MALPNAIMNADGVAIERPTNPEAGNDSHRRVLHSGLRAFVHTREEFIRPIGSTAAERVAVTEIRLNGHDDDGTVIDVQSGDFVVYKDYRGIELRVRVTAADPIFVLGKLDRITLTADLT